MRSKAWPSLEATPPLAKVMRVLFDQGTPAPLRHVLTGHTVSTAFEQGWAQLENGDLLSAAEELFDVLITTDRNLRYQQNLSGRRLAILTLWTTSWPNIQRHLPQIVAAVDEINQGDFVELSFS
jgi:hypothetical protein